MFGNNTLATTYNITKSWLQPPKSTLLTLAIRVFLCAAAGWYIALSRTHLGPVGGQDHHQAVAGGACVIQEGVEGIFGVLGHAGARPLAQKSFGLVDEQKQPPAIQHGAGTTSLAFCLVHSNYMY